MSEEPGRFQGLRAAAEPEPQRGRFQLPHLQSPFSGAKVLSALEATQLRPAIIGFLKKSAEYADEGMSNTNRAHAECDVWTGPSGLNDEDYDVLADVLIARARLDAAVAQGVRAMAAAFHRWQVLLILLPKFAASYRFYVGNGGFAWPF